jgi:hypothetical protein
VWSESPISGNGTSGNPLSMDSASASNGGYLTANDWTRFNNGNTVTANAPLSGDGTSGDPLVISQSNGSTDGYLTSSDWTRFDDKLDSVWSESPISGNGTSSDPLTMDSASASNGGYLTANDWTRFNNGNTVTANAPLDGDGTSGDPLVISQSDGSTDGYLSSTDWNTFNDKLDSVWSESPISGNGTNGDPLTMDSASASNGGYLTAYDWSRFDDANSVSTQLPVRGDGSSGNPVRMLAANSATDGYLTNDDWIDFDSKVDSVAGSPPVRTTIAGNGTVYIQMSAANSVNDGYLTNDKYIEFDNKLDDVIALAPVISSVFGGNTKRISMLEANASTDGYLDNDDWTTFNNKLDSIYTEDPITGNGLQADPISIAKASASTDGYLSKEDWASFNQNRDTLMYTDVFISDGLSDSLDIKFASPSQRGIVSTGPQTFGGDKSFDSEVKVLNQKHVWFYDQDTSDYVKFRAAQNLTSSTTYVWPETYGTNNQVLTTDNTGILTWEDVDAGDGYIKYGTNSTQNSATISENLFDVSYASTSTGDAVGAKITSTGGSTDGEATGLTVTAVSNGTDKDATAIKAIATVNDSGVNYALDAEGVINTDTQYNLSDTVMIHNKLQGVYIGNNAGKDITSGSGNIAIGYETMNSSTTAEDNVAIGDNIATDLAGKSNVLIGAGVTVGNDAADSNNVAIGKDATINHANAKNSTAIGAYAQVNADHSLVLGAIDGVNGADSTVNVGIGTQTPDARLQVLSTDSTTQAVKIGKDDDFGTLQFASLKEVSGTQLPAGYSVYVFTSNPGSTVSFPDGEDGQICYIINKAGAGDIVVDTFNPFNDQVGEDQIKMFMHYDGDWYKIQQ